MDFGVRDRPEILVTTDVTKMTSRNFKLKVCRPVGKCGIIVGSNFFTACPYIK